MCSSVAALHCSSQGKFRRSLPSFISLLVTCQGRQSGGAFPTPKHRRRFVSPPWDGQERHRAMSEQLQPALGIQRCHGP
jgi:hypothetical protein